MTATSDIAEASLSRIATCTFNSPKKRLCPVSFQSEDLHLSKKINVDDRTGERFLQAKGLLNSRGPQKTSPSLLPSKQPEISLVCSSPRIFLIKDFLCQEDCQVRNHAQPQSCSFVCVSCCCMLLQQLSLDTTLILCRD